MFAQADLDRLLDAMRANGVTSLSLKEGEDRLKLELEPQIPPAHAPTPVVARRVAAQSPCIGRFVPRGGEDGLTPFDDGCRVNTGETLGYVAQGQALALVVAPVEGTLSGRVPEKGTVFGYGDTVFEVEVLP